MNADRTCILVSGLPASGKSTLGYAVAHRLNLTCLDKDDYLEALFCDNAIGNLGWRQKLSRKSDKMLQRDANAHAIPVLVSHWRPLDADSKSGTPVDWILRDYTRIVELYCICSVAEATRRFIHRNRHPGHLDRLKTEVEVQYWLGEYQRSLPLALGRLETVNTDAEFDLENLVGRIFGHIQNG